MFNVLEWITCARILRFVNNGRQSLRDLRYPFQGRDDASNFGLQMLNQNIESLRKGAYVGHVKTDIRTTYQPGTSITKDLSHNATLFYLLILSPYYRREGMLEIMEYIPEEKVDFCITQLGEAKRYLLENCFEKMEIYNMMFYYDIFIMLLSGIQNSENLLDDANDASYTSHFYYTKNMDIYQYLRWAMFDLHDKSLFTLENVIEFYTNVELQTIGILDVEMVITALCAAKDGYGEAISNDSLMYAIQRVMYFFEEHPEQKYKDRLKRIFEKNDNHPQVTGLIQNIISGSTRE